MNRIISEDAINQILKIVSDIPTRNGLPIVDIIRSLPEEALFDEILEKASA